MKRGELKLFALALLSCANIMGLSAQSVVKVAAAANLRYVLSEFEQLYESNNDVDLQINYGASGRFYQQIINGAPFDLFLSADNTLPDKLRAEGVTSAPSYIYASGKLALYGLQSDIDKYGLELLKQPNIGRISIANPRTAPYGERSVELLTSLGLWESLSSNVAYGDSIAQAAQFAITGNCQFGFVALSLLLNPDEKIKGSYYIIPEELYKPISQAGVTLKAGEATKFFEFLRSDKSTAIWNKYGYSTAQ